MTDHAQTLHKCPTCGSPKPHLHPAMQFEGEVRPCDDAEVGGVLAEISRESRENHVLNHVMLRRWYDLLERLAGERKELFEANGYAANELGKAQDRLAEREAELAKASWKRGNENSRGGQLIEAAFEYLNIPTQQNHTEYVIVRWNDGRWEFTNGDGYEGPSDELPAFYRDFETPEHYTAFG